MTDIASLGKDDAMELLFGQTDYADRLSFPIDTMKIAKALGADVYEADLEAHVHSLTVRNDGEKPKVLLNRTLGHVGKRLACAHEIATLVANQENPGQYGTVNDGKDMTEFVATLLMPGNVVRKYWAKAYSLVKMSKIFGVAPNVMLDRLDALRLGGN